METFLGVNSLKKIRSYLLITKPSLKALNYLVLSIIAFLILISAFATYLLSGIHQRSLLAQREGIVVALTTQSITQDIKLGLIGEVYRKCKALYVDHNLSYIELTDYSGQVICHFGQANQDNVSSHKIYFDDSESQLLGTLNIGFATLHSHDLGFSDFLIVVLIVLFAFVLIFVFMMSIYSKFITTPLARLHVSLGSLSYGKSLTDLMSYECATFEIDQLRKSLVGLMQESLDQTRALVESRESAAVAQMSKQVAHDIRAPLAALRLVIKRTKNFPVDQMGLINSAAHRIEAISKKLLVRTTGSVSLVEGREEVISYQDFFSIVEEIISEKRIFSENCVFVLNSNVKNFYSVSISAERTELGRIISNAIDNSLEAGSTAVSLNVDIEDAGLALKICDNGAGIDSAIIPFLFNKGASFRDRSKEPGYGLGLFHCRSTMLGWGGDCKIESILNQETILTLNFRINKS